MQAQVMVDVPLMQTDQAYTYQVPVAFEELLQIGVRVHVPFGRGNRLIQGIVVGLQSEDTVADAKDIVEVLDFQPVLNSEQLWLAGQMRQTVFS